METRRALWLCRVMRTPEDTATDPDQLIRFGSIASVDLAAARCVVTLDDDSISPPVRWFEMRMGRTRTWSPPSKGEQVVLLCPAGEIGAAVALRGLISDAYPAPGNSLTEFLAAYEDGATITYDPTGHDLIINLPPAGKVTIIAPAGVSLESDLSVKGSISATGVIASDVGATGAFTTPTGQSVTVSGGIVDNIN